MVVKVNSVNLTVVGSARTMQLFVIAVVGCGWLWLAVVGSGWLHQNNGDHFKRFI